MSEKSLDQLIESIKSEAIESANKESKQILADANAKAERILKNAEDQRNQIIDDANSEAEAIVKKGESALQQAARDLNVAVRNDLIGLLSAVLDKQVSNEFSPDLVKTAILKVIENVGSNVELRLSEEFESELAQYVHSELQNSKDLVSLKKDAGILSGLAISNTNEGWSYEITPEQVAGLLREHLTGQWVNLLKNTEEA